MSTSRVAVVTGAARGIGAAVAQRLAADGHKVAILDRDEAAAVEVAEKIRAGGGEALAHGVDVSVEEQVAEATGAVREALGPMTVLVNNAGVIRDNLLFKMSVADWDTVAAVHGRGAFLMARAVQKDMVDAGWGRIVNLSSTSALGNRGQANYSWAKAGVQGFTKTLAVELGRFGITVNAIGPGFVDTDMTRATAARIGVSYDEFVAQVAAQTAVNRVGRPDDIAAAVAYLTSEEASYVSGQVLYVAGGPVD